MRARPIAVALACAVAAGGCASPAPGRTVLQASGAPYDSAVTEAVAPGIVHRRFVSIQGPQSIHVLEIDLLRSELAIRAAHAFDSLRGRERTSAIVQRIGTRAGEPVAAVNADFFSLRTGENENNQVVEGEVLKAVPVTDSPFDSLHTIHSQFGMTCAGRPVLERFVFDGVVLTPPPATALLPLDAVNFRPRTDALVLYTARYGTTPNDSAAPATAELPLRVTTQHGDTTSYRVIGPPRTGGGLPLQTGEAALSGTGVAADVVQRVAPSIGSGGTLRIVMGFRPKRGRLCTLVGGWPRIVADGRSIADSVDRLEGTFPRFSVTRHPRTGVGFSSDSSRLFLVTVDGRSESSSGMSLVEFAELMRSLGIVHGLNLDGGGSTTMVIRDRVVNHPSDSTGERTVGNALMVVRKR